MGGSFSYCQPPQTLLQMRISQPVRQTGKWRQKSRKQIHAYMFGEVSMRLEEDAGLCFHALVMVSHFPGQQTY